MLRSVLESIPKRDWFSFKTEANLDSIEILDSVSSVLYLFVLLSLELVIDSFCGCPTAVSSVSLPSFSVCFFQVLEVFLGYLQIRFFA